MTARAASVAAVLVALTLACSTTPKRADDGASTSPPGSGVPCGTKTCPQGQVCCNASCGICTPPDGYCTQQFCTPPAPAPAEPACRSDGDCRAFSDYCTGCDCRALARTDPDPTCSGPGVRCLADPCGERAAVCERGRCALRARTR